MKVSVQDKVFEIFPDLRLGLIYVKNLKYNKKAEKIAAEKLSDAQKLAIKHFPDEPFSSNKVIAKWREAFQKFKTKKGTRCSIEALLKRVSQGKELSPILPIVDIYNAASLEFGVPCGAEDTDKIVNNMQLAFANGDEIFLPLGEEESQPPYENELVYKDEEGAICRCLNWREAQRTMITENTKSVIFVIEEIDKNNFENFEGALNAIKQSLNEIGSFDKLETVILDISNSGISF